MKTIIASKNAPGAIGPYNQAVKAGSTVYCSGQLGLVPATGKLAEGIEAQARQSFSNLRAVIEEAGGSLSDVVKFTLFLTDLKNFGIVNNVMKEFVPEPFPARSCVEVSALPAGGLFEAEAIAVIE